MPFTRREFLQTSATVVVASSALFSTAIAKPKKNSLARQLGITTSSLSGYLAATPTKGKITALELPKILREELGMTVIDLNTSTIASTHPAYLEKLRAAADKAGCVLANLKLNQRGLDMNSPDKAVREKALATYKKSIDAAAILGLKWARPLPLKPLPDMAIHVTSYRELCDYAAKKNIQMLIENYGWMESDADSVPKLVKAIDRNVAVSPDIGNWKTNELRYAGLAKSFPLAVTCDFKARQLGPNGEHKLYDLERCFDIGGKAGFEGPWCFEHANADRKKLFAELGLLRDMLRGWMKAAG
jgi:hypothetical protein